MLMIYILSGKVFGNHIYEIDCTYNLNERFFSDITGYPESNILHYSAAVQNISIHACKKMIHDAFLTGKMKCDSNFYNINISEAKKKIIDIVSRLEYKNNNDKQCIKESKFKLCFF